MLYPANLLTIFYLRKMPRDVLILISKKGLLTIEKRLARVDTIKLISYEVKKEISSDLELKKAYIQAVSNSNWANYGYLVALEFSDNLFEEMERYNRSFGIGIIQLHSYPYQSKILFPIKYRDMDIKTIDKLCYINKNFRIFLEQVDNLMTAQERYFKSIEKEFDQFCDRYFESNSQIKEHCRQNNIP